MRKGDAEMIEALTPRDEDGRDYQAHPRGGLLDELRMAEAMLEETEPSKMVPRVTIFDRREEEES